MKRTKKRVEAPICDLAKTIGAAARDRRQALGFTQEEVAFDSGMSVAMLCAVERGKRSVSTGSLERLAQALGTHPAVLCGGRP